MIVLRNSKPKAKKNHKCDFCDGLIKIGEVYNYHANVCDGEFYTWKSHVNCSRIANILEMYDDTDEGVNDDMFQEHIRYEFANLRDKLGLDSDIFENEENSFFLELEFVINYHLKRIENARK